MNKKKNYNYIYGYTTYLMITDMFTKRTALQNSRNPCCDRPCDKNEINHFYFD